MKIIRDIESPPGGWKFTVPQTNVTVRGDYAKTTRSKVTAHLVANGLPVPSQADFEESLCSQNGHGGPWCGEETKPVDPDAPMITKATIKRFLRTAVELLKNRTLVSKDEHDRRMSICETCPMRSLEGFGCTGCITEVREIERLVGKMPEGGSLICKSCHCHCWSKAWLPQETLDKAERNETIAYDPGCWRLGN